MKKKQKIFFDLENYDFTPFARELTEEEMYLVNGGRVVKGSARETEVVPSRPSSSSESGNSSGSSSTSNSSPAPAETQPSTTSSSQQNNTESQPQTSSAPTCSDMMTKARVLLILVVVFCRTQAPMVHHQLIDVGGVAVSAVSI